MAIPKFNSSDHQQVFLAMFDERWQIKKKLLDSIKDDLYPGYTWDQIHPRTLTTINDMVQSLMYDIEYEFKKQYPEYKNDEDDIFVPYRSFKQSVAEALKEAMNDPLHCETFLGDHEEC